ncbi:MAG: hypothetical protein GY895_18330 [Phycisphaera sp.]|nr:hypothetical protein [Phycisphaera sp.]
MVNRHGVQLVEIILVKIVLIGGAMALRTTVGGATADTLARAHVAFAGVDPEGVRKPTGLIIGGLPARSGIMLKAQESMK